MADEQSGARSTAMVTFQLNLDRLLELVARVDGAIEEYNTKELMKARERLSSARLRDDVYELGRVLGAHLRSSRAFTLQLQWYAVMLVTFAETYLQDVLADSAKFDPTLMAKSEQSAPYDQVIAAESIEDLATAMRDRWSRNFVGSGGPTFLIDRLKRMGANFREGLVGDLEELWGVRHAIVHNAGRRTSELARRHPAVTYDESKQIIVDSDQFKNYALAVIDFANSIDRFLLGRVGSDLWDK